MCVAAEQVIDDEAGDDGQDDELHDRPHHGRRIELDVGAFALEEVAELVEDAFVGMKRGTGEDEGEDQGQEPGHHAMIRYRR